MRKSSSVVDKCAFGGTSKHEEASWSVLGRLGSVLGASWSVLGASWVLVAFKVVLDVKMRFESVQDPKTLKTLMFF